MKDTAHAAARFGVRTVTGFAGSSVWHSIYTFPPTDPAYRDAGFKNFTRRWLPVLDVFDEVGGNFALEVHSTEIALDTVSAKWALAAVNHRPCFGFNHDSSHLA